MKDGTPLDHSSSDSKLASNSAGIHPSDPSSNSLPNASTEPLVGMEERLRDIFPPGLENKSSSSRGRPYTFPPRQLHEILTWNYGRNRHVEHTIVKSAWFGKQTKSARHEFIVIQVKDLMVPRLENWIVLDRNQDVRGCSRGFHAFLPNAYDAFRVSYNGDLPRLLCESQLTPYQELERIHLQPDKPMLLLDLVALVEHISGRHPIYNPLNTNCYWFTGLVWECMLQMYPTAKHEVYAPEQRGNISYFRFVPDPIQV